MTAFVQSAGLLAGMYYIEKVSAEHRAELEAEAPDEDVLKIDEQKASKKVLYRHVTQWSRLPGAVKLLLGLSTVIITISYWAILIGPSFLPAETMIRNYVLTDCISVKLDGKFWTVVTNVGWFFLALFGLSCVFLWIFGKWAAVAMARVHDFTPDIESCPIESTGSEGSSERGDATGSKAAAPRTPGTKAATGQDGVVFSQQRLQPGGNGTAPGVSSHRSTGAGTMLSRFADEKVADSDRNFKRDFEKKLPGMTLEQLGDLKVAWSDRKSAGYSAKTHAQVMSLIDAELATRGAPQGGNKDGR